MTTLTRTGTVTLDQARLASAVHRALLLVAFLMMLGAFLPLLSGQLAAGSSSYSASVRPYSIARQGLFVLVFTYALFVRGGWRELAVAWPVVLVVSYFYLSTQWSEYPEDSLRSLVAFSFQLMFGVILCAGRSADKVVDDLRVLCMGVVCALLASLLLQPGTAFETHGYVGAFRGPFWSKNQTGPVCALTSAVLFIAIAWPGSRKVTLVERGVFGVSLFLLFATQSMTSIVAVLVSILIALALKALSTARISGFTRAALVGAALFLGTGFYFVGQKILVAALESVGRNPTLTGRDTIWDIVLRMISERPAFGYGFGGFWQRFQGAHSAWSEAGLWQINQAHNGFLEAWLAGGLIGLCLVVLVYLYLFAQILGQLTTRSPTVATSLATVLTLQSFMTNLTESNFPYESWASGAMLTIALILLSKNRDAVRRQTTGHQSQGAPRARAHATPSSTFIQNQDGRI